MPALELLAPLSASLRHARRQLRLGRGALSSESIAPPDRIDAALIALDDHVSALQFGFQSALYASWNYLAAGRDRLREFLSLPPSTLLAYASVAVMAVILTNDLLRRTPAIPEPAAKMRPQPDWIEIPRAHGAFALNASGLESVESQYIVRRHRSGGGRTDELTFGNPVARGPYIRVVLYRPGPEGVAEPDPLEAVVEVASRSSINADLHETERKLATKFGVLPLVAMIVKNGRGQRRCVATSAAWSDPRLGLTAWWCNEGDELVAHGEFACLIDRLALMSAGGDDRLAELFAQAELRRRSCGPDGSLVSPTPKRHDDWIHTKAVPPLRGRQPAR